MHKKYLEDGAVDAREFSVSLDLPVNPIPLV